MVSITGHTMVLAFSPILNTKHEANGMQKTEKNVTLVKYLVLLLLLILYSGCVRTNTKRSFFGFRFSESSYSSNLVYPPLQQRLNPARDALTVAIKECQYVTRSVGGPDETCPDQTFPFVGADEPHTFQITDVIS